MAIDFQPVNSSNLAAVGYDKDTQTLHVQFSSGGAYRYTGVPASTHQALMAAPSKGGFLAKHIKGRFFCQRG